ncbi:MAG: gliding motility protein GldL, partial [Candidatus Limisoma sp.]
LMFVLTAFDRPPKEYHWEEVFPVLSTNNPEDRPDFAGGGGEALAGEAAEGGTITINGGGTAGVVAGGVVAGNVEGMTDVNEQYVSQVAAINEQMEQLRQTTEALNHVSSVLLESYRAITDNSENITSSSTGYVEQMTSLNRNIAGLNTIYEIQLKSISSQLDNIDKVNQGLKAISRMYEQSASESNRYCEETHKMAQYMQQLNSVYEKMITAMTINMYRPMVNTDDLTPRQPQAPEADTENNQ